MKYKPFRGRKLSITVGWDNKVKLAIASSRLGKSQSYVINQLISRLELEDWDQVKESLVKSLTAGQTVQQFIDMHKEKSQ